MNSVVTGLSGTSQGSLPVSPEENRFITKDALARRYGVCKGTIEKWMKARILVFLKVRRVVRFHVEGCDKALRKRGLLN